MSLLENPKVSEDSKVRLAMLYALRYEKMPGNATPQIIDKLFKTGVNEKKVAVGLVYACLLLSAKLTSNHSPDDCDPYQICRRRPTPGRYF